MNNRKEWLEGRKSYLGGTDIASICGTSKYKSPLDVYLSKTSDESEQEINPAMRWGSLLEDDIATAYAEDTGFNIEIEPNVLFHPEHAFLGANIDRWADDKKHVLECKTAGFMKAKDWGDEGTSQIPESYLVQVAWYAAICDVDRVDIAVLIGGQDFRIYTYTRDKEFEEKLIKIAVNFWYNHVQKRIPPKCSNLSDTFNLFPIGNHKELTASEHVNEKIKELKIMKEQERSLQKSIDILKVEIQEFMQDYDVLLDNNGSIVATWKNSSPRASFNLRQLKKECQDIYLQYVNYAKQSRIFLIK